MYLHWSHPGFDPCEGRSNFLTESDLLIGTHLLVGEKTNGNKSTNDDLYFVLKSRFQRSRQWQAWVIVSLQSIYQVNSL